jgi:PPOX class probable F420-dependent enzyme
VRLIDALEFAQANHRAVLCTFRPDDRVQMSPVLAAAHPEGFLEVSSRKSAFKVRWIRRDPRVSLCVLSDDFFGPWVQIDGTAEIVSLPEAMDGLVEHYRRISGEHPDWDEYRTAMEDQRRVLIRVHPEHAGPDQHG